MEMKLRNMVGHMTILLILSGSAVFAEDSQYMGISKARDFVLADTGITEADVIFKKLKLDVKNAGYGYDLEIQTKRESFI